MFGAIAPDFDLAYFFLKDHVLHHTHRFYFHYPVIWLSILPISVLWRRLDNYRSQNAAFMLIFAVNGLIHLVLDTIAGEIYWSAGLGGVGRPFGIGQYLPWDECFLELFVFLWAFYLWKKEPINTLVKNMDKYVE